MLKDIRIERKEKHFIKIKSPIGISTSVVCPHFTVLFKIKIVSPITINSFVCLGSALNNNKTTYLFMYSKIWINSQEKPYPNVFIFQI